MKEEIKTAIWVFIYAIAMGFLEAAVVIYVRELYYPNGFNFPLKEMPLWLVKVEILREAATLIMLLAIAVLSGRNKWQRWGYFLISFAIWDMVYYLGLKWFLDWPDSFFTWDVLFLIPITWVGPVITPIIIAILMVVFGSMLVYTNRQSHCFPVIKLESSTLFLGTFICIVSFTLDYTQQLIEQGSATVNAAMLLSKTYVPRDFNWGIYFIGLAFMLYGILHFGWQYYRRNKPQRS